MATDIYRTIAKNGENETVIKKSRFICHLQRVHTVAAAETFFATVRKAEAKATHNVPVYLLGDHDEQQHANDDGEPSGTAAVPMLRVLQQMGLHDVAAVTTRYFGGIKLGAGGLIRAYAGSVTAAVHVVGIVRRVPHTKLQLTIGYPQLDPVQHWLTEQGLALTELSYGVAVTGAVLVPTDQATALQNGLTELLSGQLTIENSGEAMVEVPTELPGK